MIYNYNLSKGRLISDNGAVLSDRPAIRFATKPPWTIRFCDVSAGAVTALDVSDAVAWRAAVDRDHSTATEPMCRTKRLSGVVLLAVSARSPKTLNHKQWKI